MAAPATTIVTAESLVLSQMEKGSKITNRQAFEGILTKQMDSISQIAARHISASRLISIAVGAAMRNPLLFKCEASTVVRSLLQAAELGLEVGALQEAHLVPFKNSKRDCYECQLLIDYRGFLKLCWNSGMVKSIDASVVYVDDAFTFRKGTEISITYEPNIDVAMPERFWPDDNDSSVANRWDKVRCVYAAAELTTGGKVAIVLTRAQVERYRAMSKARDSNFWVGHWEAMAMKTALRRLQTFLPKSSNLAVALAVDEMAEFGNVAAPSFEIPEANYAVDEETGEIGSGMAAAKASLKGKAAETIGKPPPDADKIEAEQQAALTETGK